MAHYVYIIYSGSHGQFYVGESVNPAQRLVEHNSGYYEGASTSKATDWELSCTLECASREVALKIEAHIKAMKSRVYIKNLLQYPEMGEKLLQRYS